MAAADSLQGGESSGFDDEESVPSPQDSRQETGRKQSVSFDVDTSAMGSTPGATSGAVGPTMRRSSTTKDATQPSSSPSPIFRRSKTGIGIPPALLSPKSVTTPASRASLDHSSMSLSMRKRMSVSMRMETPSTQDNSQVGDGLTPMGRRLLMVGSMNMSDHHRERWTNVFKKLQEEGEIHCDNLRLALDLAGHPRGREDQIELIHAELTPYNTLDLKEFLKFMQCYEICLDEQYEEEFRKVDVDHSGTLEVSELAAFLRSSGITPMRQVLNELMTEVAGAGVEGLTMLQFRSLDRIIRSREGWCKEDVDSFKALFHRLDTRQSGDIDHKELCHFLRWFGYHIEENDLKALVAEVDVDHSNSLNFQELLVCMRKARESEVRVIEGIHDAPGRGCNGLEEALRMLSCLGYTPGREVVSELVMKHVGALDADLDMDLLWEMLQEYRAKEGFLQSEYDELCTVFDEYDIDGTGEVSSVDLSNVLRGTGYKTAWDLQQMLVADIDVDGSGHIKKKEFIKMVAKHHDMYVKELLDCYKALQVTEEGPVRGVPLLSAMFTAALLPENCDIGHLMDDDLEVGIYDLSDITMQIHRQSRANFRANAGFSQGQVMQFRASFFDLDKDGSGDLSDGELRALILEVVPDMARDPTSRPAVIKMLKEADVDQDGRLHFGEYLRFMSNLRNMREQKTWEKEQEARAKTGFTLEEIEEFRKIFLERAQTVDEDQEHVRELTFQDVMKFFGGPADLSKADIQILADEFQAVTGVSARSMSAQFPNEANVQPPISKSVTRSSMNMLWEEVRRVADLHSMDTLSEDGMSSLPSSHRGSLEHLASGRSSFVESLSPHAVPRTVSQRGSLAGNKRFSGAAGSGMSSPQAHMPRASLPVNGNMPRASLLTSAIQPRGSLAGGNMPRGSLLGGGNMPRGSLLANGNMPRGSLLANGGMARASLLSPSGEVALGAALAESEPSQATSKKGADFPEFLFLMRRLIDMNFAGIALKFGEDLDLDDS